MPPSLLRLACLCLFPLPAVAQSPEDSLAFITPSGRIPGKIGIYFFPALPTGDFGDDYGPNAGLATRGIGLGIEFVYSIGETPLGWVSGAAIAVNPINQDVAADIVEDQLPAENIEVGGGTWFNVPFLTGVKIEGRPIPQVAFNAQAQIGLTIVNQADYTFTSPDYQAELASETAFAPGFMVGGGLSLFDRLNLGVRFFRTAEADMEGEFRDTRFQSAKQEGDFVISFLAFALGVQF